MGLFKRTNESKSKQELPNKAAGASMPKQGNTDALWSRLRKIQTDQATYDAKLRDLQRDLWRIEKKLSSHGDAPLTQQLTPDEALTPLERAMRVATGGK